MPGSERVSEGLCPVGFTQSVVNQWSDPLTEFESQGLNPVVSIPDKFSVTPDGVRGRGHCTEKVPIFTPVGTLSRNYILVVLQTLILIRARYFILTCIPSNMVR